MIGSTIRMDLHAFIYIIYIRVFICAFACHSKLDMHVNTKILIAGNVTCMCASTSQIVPLHIMWVIDLCHSAFNLLKGYYLTLFM